MQRLSLLTLTLGAILTANAYAPQIYPGYNFCGVSPDGTYALSFDNPSTGVMNLITGEALQIPTGYDYGVGPGNAISNSATIAGSSLSDRAAIWKNGKWQLINPSAKVRASYAFGITPDDSRIVGIVQSDEYKNDEFEGLMYVPCYWDLQPDGSYTEAKVLPHPVTDLTNRSPQSVTAVWVSEDGNTIAGQMEDYMGYIYQPIVFTYNGYSWDYTLIADDLFHVDGLVAPPYPSHEPLPTDYMTPEDIDDYNADVKAWEDDPNAPAFRYPVYEDYMDPEKWSEFQEDLGEYLDQVSEFSEYYSELVQKVPTFEKNNVLLSSDGKYYASTDVKVYINPELFLYNYVKTPYLINVETDEWTAYSDPEANVYVTSLGDDGTLLGQVNDGEAYMAYILTPGAKKFIPFLSLMEQQNPSIADWMKENMTHSYQLLDPETGIYDTSAVATGSPFATPDLSTIVFGLQNFWQYPDEEGYAPFYGYAIQPGIAGVESIGAESIHDGVYRVFNLQGVKILETKDASAIYQLPHGIYVVNGKKILL